ncbi:MAG TPA: hypothetical protein VN662_08755 [Rhodanobacteraceae bacterium]|nr:hypothetical protein [Rhodanobacteraceae bacterium]
MMEDLTESRELAQATRIANSAHELAVELQIDSPAALDIAGDELRRLVQRKKEIEELRLSLTRPIDEAKKRIMDLFRLPTDRLAEAEGMLRRSIVIYQSAEREKAEKTRREAEAAARAERERLERERQAAEAEERRIREEQAKAERERLAAIERERGAGNEAAAKEAERIAREQAEAAERAAAEARGRADAARTEIEIADVAPVLPMIAPAKTDGISARQNWKAECTDLQALVSAAAAASARGDTTLLGYLEPNTKALGQVAKALKGAARIPGVRIFAEESIAVRRAG